MGEYGGGGVGWRGGDMWDKVGRGVFLRVGGWWRGVWGWDVEPVGASHAVTSSLNSLFLRTS